MKFKGIMVDGLAGTWTQMGEPETFNFRGREELLYALKHDQYSLNDNHIVVDENGELVSTGCGQGLETIRIRLAAKQPVSDWK